MKKKNQNINYFFFLFPYKLSLIGLLRNITKIKWQGCLVLITNKPWQIKAAVCIVFPSYMCFTFLLS